MASSWGKLLALVPEGSRVLDVGCGYGAFASALRRQRRCVVVGIESDVTAAEAARLRCHKLFVGDAIEILRDRHFTGEFDIILLSDVLEHLADPRGTLELLARCLRPGGVLLASVPNATHLSVVVELARGRFPRSREGILDETHVQFFGEQDLLSLFGAADYVARIADRVLVDPRGTELRTDLSAVPDSVLEFLDRNPNSTTYQFIIRAVPRAWATDAERTATNSPPPSSRVVGRMASEIADLHEKLRTYHEALSRKDADMAAIQERRPAIDRNPRASGSFSLLRRRLAARLTADDAARLRVLFVADRQDAPFRYRCVHACEQLRDSGVIANVLRVDDTRLLDELPRYSTVVLARLGWSGRVEQIVERARSSGAAVAFEIDDLIFDPLDEALLPFLRDADAARQQEYRDTIHGLHRTAMASDYVIASTPVIAGRARRLGKEAFVHPNVLTRDYVRLSRLVAPLRGRLQDGPLVGYLSGSNTHDGDLRSIAAPLQRFLDRRPDARLLLCGHVEPPSSLARLRDRIVRIPYLDHRAYPWAMARCRAVLAPLEELNDFTDAKSALKIFEAGVFGIPAIASPSAAYLEAITHGVSGFVATTPDEWEQALSEVTEPKESRRMGDCARTLALDEYTAGSYRDVLARELLTRTGHHDGSRVTQRAIPIEERERRRPFARAAIQAIAIARAFSRASSSGPGPAPAALKVDVLEEDAPVVRDVAAAVRRGRTLLLGGHEFGWLLADREQPLLASAHSDAAPLPDCLTPGTRFASSDGDPRFTFGERVPRLPQPQAILLQLRTRAGSGVANAQVYWKRHKRDCFEEARSVSFSVVDDGALHTYVAALEDGESGHRWPNEDVYVRLDPLDRAGTFEVVTAALLYQRTNQTAEAPDLRRGLAERFLRGEGIEIGALQNPLPLPAFAHVRYVDRLTQAEARAHYPELDAQPLVNPSIISEADRLTAVREASLDFVVCNHVLEHVRDPIGALREWLRVLRPGGHLYVAIPDRDNPLDRPRRVTSFEHLRSDHLQKELRDSGDAAHFLEWSRSVRPQFTDEQQRCFAEQLRQQGYGIHFHVFDGALFERLLEEVCTDSNSVVVELQANPIEDYGEYIAVVRKL